jgi:hypothetical protein
MLKNWKRPWWNRKMRTSLTGKAYKTKIISIEVEGLEAALLAQRLKFVVLLLRAIGFMRCLRAILVLWLLLGFFVEHDAVVGFIFGHG